MADPMSKLIVGNDEFEIVDAAARSNLSNIIAGERMDVGVWEQGSLVNGVPTASTTRIRTSDYIPVSVGEIISVYPHNQYYYISYFDATKTFVNAFGWYLDYREITVEYDGYIKIVLAKNPIFDTITPIERVFTANIGTPISKAMTRLKYGDFFYSGEKINIAGLHGFTSKVAFELPAVANIQGVAEYNNQYFAWLTDGTINVYSNTGTLIANFASGLPADGIHGNTLCFDADMHDGNSQFPYLFIAQYLYNGGIYIMNLTESSGTYAMTQKQIFILDDLTKATVGSGYADFAIDFKNGHFYLIKYVTASTYQASAGNYTIITKFDLPAITGTNYRFKDADIIDQFVVDIPIYARQQSVYYNGKIYFTAGASTTGGQATLYVVDFNTKTVETIVDIGGAVEYNEPEAAIIHNSEMLIFSNYTKNVYSLEF